MEVIVYPQMSLAGKLYPDVSLAQARQRRDRSLSIAFGDFQRGYTIVDLNI